MVHTPRLYSPFAVIFLIAGLSAALPAQGYTGETQSFRVVELVRGLRNPWSLAFLPDGRLLVTERPGALLLLSPRTDGSYDRAIVSGTPRVAATGQGGLLDVALDPGFPGLPFVYLTFAHPGTGGAGTALGRGRLDGNTLREFTVLWELARKTTSGNHFGSRIAFAPDGTFYFNVSDRGAQDRAQDHQDAAGTIIRIKPDGSIPVDNPGRSIRSWLPELWTVGHRNIQGLAFHGSGRLWATEHGPRGGDELNLIRPGLNYGWPLATHGVNYSGSPVSPHKTLPGMEDPLAVWTPSIAPSGLAWVPMDSPLTGWRSSLLSENLAGQETLLKQVLGRIRDARVGPDGLVYLLTDANPGALYRIQPEP